MKLALWQADPTNGQIEARFVALAAQLAAAASAGARMLILPELFLPGYNRPDLHGTLAQPMNGAWMGRLRDMALQAQCGICIGWAERDGDAVFNAATTISHNGEILAHYRKVQLYGLMEEASFQRGDALCAVFSLEDMTSAMLICYDVEFPGHAAALAAGGARLILVPTANPTGFEHVQRILVPARAHENRAVVAYANFTGEEGGLRYGGGSVIAGPDGQPLAMAGPYGEALLVVDLAAISQIPASGWAAPEGAYHPH